VTSTDAPFARIGIVGLGLMGGSIALAARRRWPDVSVVGFDRSPRIAEAARKDAVHDTVADLAGLARTDLVVLAVPLAAINDTLAVIAGIGRRPVVTDLGSTKRNVMAAAAAAGVPSFVGGHPMAGSEHAGLDHARADLFEGRPWLLVPGSGSGEHNRRVEQFAAGLGGVPQWTDAEAHDRMVAYVSHLPQLLAVALMNSAEDAIGANGLSAAGRAFGEMTRLASSPPGMWQSIFSANADFVSQALARFMTNLPTPDHLRNQDWVTDAFGRAGAARARETSSGRRKS
jgi:prephenate dehydrogenase